MSINKMARKSKFVLNTTNKDDYNIKDVPIIHLRIGKDEDIEEFKKIIQEKFNINIDNVKCTIEKTDNNKVLNVDWQEMPKWGYNKNLWPHYEIYCITDADRYALGKALNIDISPTTKSVWYKERPKLGDKNEYWTTKEPIKKTKYPLYIISYKRPQKRLTERALNKMNCDYYIVVETDQIEEYIKYGCPKEHILEFSKEEKTKWTTGNFKDDAGSIPVRNFIWQHSIKNGHKKHWCIDDNIDGFYIFNDNKRILANTCAPFKIIEDYCDRYKNIKMAGMNYLSFMPEISKKRVLIQKNTRIYSIILLSNNANKSMADHEGWKGEFLWRGAYNEDTDLSLRLLKSGKPTALFNCFLGNKQTTMSCKGGNTDSVYKGNGLQLKLDSLIKQHPDVCRGTIKFKKVHHQVNYASYENLEFKYKEGVKEKLKDEYNDYGLIIKVNKDIKERNNRQKEFKERTITEEEPTIIEEEPTITEEEPTIIEEEGLMLIEEPTITEEPTEKDYNKLFKLLDDNHINKVDKAEVFIKGLKLTDEEKKQLAIKILSM